MYAKLFDRIAQSSLMEEAIPTRYLFVFMLAIADPRGAVIGTDVAIARRLNMGLPEFQAAIAALMRPDHNSNSQAHEGRRIIRSEGERGYLIVNYLRYRNLRDEEHRREYQRVLMAERRANEKRSKGEAVMLAPVSSVSTVSTGKRSLAKAESESESESEDTYVSQSAQPTSEVLPLEAQLWNAEPNLPAIRKVSLSRLRSLKARRTDEFFRENVRAAIKRIVASPFCLGTGSRGWKATFDWLLKPDTVLKVMEGKYDGTPAPALTPGQRTAQRITLEKAIAADTAQIDELKYELDLFVVNDRDKKQAELKAIKARRAANKERLSALEEQQQPLALPVPQPNGETK